MRAGDFQFLAELVRRRSGLELTPDRMHLIEARLAPVATRFGFRALGPMLEELRDVPEGLAASVIEALTIHDTSFFRDAEVFDGFRAVVLPQLLQARARSRRFRIWCAGASTGQEPYSLAMILADAQLSGWEIELIATDLSGQAIERAREGVYTQREVRQGIGSRHLAAYFRPEADRWRIDERVRRMVTFHSLNLLDDFDWLGELDVIFRRNVLMYFDARSKAAVLAKLAAVLAPDGWLALGASERMAGQALAPADARAFYRKAVRRPRLTLLAG